MKKTSWHQIDTHYLPKHDSLLSCLVLLTRFFQNPYSSKTLCARLPLVNNKLTKELLPRAAARAKLKVTEVDEGLDKLKDENHPSILCLKNGNYALLIQDESGAHKILHTDDPKTLQDVSTLKKNDLVSAFTVEPEYQNTHRSGETLSKDKKNWFWKVMIKSWPTYTEVLAASFLVNIFALVVPLFTMNVYDRVVPNNALDTMWVLASGVGLVFFFDILLKTLRGYFIDMANKRSDQVLSANIFHQVLGVNMTARPKSIGGLANSVQSYEIFRDFITSTTMTAIVDLPFCLLFLFIIYLVGGSIVIIPAIMVPLVFGLGFLLQIPLIRLTKEGYKHSSEKQATLIESLNNIEAVKTSSAESLLQSKWEQLIHLSAKNNHKLKFISNLTINITLLSQQLAYIGIVIFGVYKISEGEMTTGALIACTMLAGRALAPLSQVASLFTRYYQSVNALESLDNIMHMPTDVDENSHYLHRPVIKGNIAFQHVTFQYQSNTLPILKKINFQIRSGEKVAIIGRVGSGKTTIAKLILRLYEPTDGTILIDGTDYRQINPDDLRDQIGFVSQDVSLFYGSVRDNITIGTPFVDDATLLNVANISGVDNITSKHPEGFDRQIGEKGAELSGGQRQSIAIARALIKRPQLLVLDEPTSAMDDTSEKRFKQHLLNYLTPTHTLVLVTHKLSMLELVDRIIVIDEGNIVADGDKESVLHALRAGLSKDKVS